MISRELQYSSKAGKEILKPVAEVIDGFLNPKAVATVRWTLTIEDTVGHVADSVTNEKKLSPSLTGDSIPGDDPRLHERQITSVRMESDGTQEVKMDCGHTTLMIVPVPADWTKMRCTLCLTDFVDEVRKARGQR